MSYAWTASLQGGTLTVSDPSSRANAFLAAIAPDAALEVDDDGAALTGSVPAGCAYDADAALLRCLPGLASGLAINGGPGADTITNATALPAALSGGSDADQLDGGTAADVLDGGDADDVLAGGDGGDQLNGGAGNDALEGGAGGDGLSGAAGADVLDGAGGDDALDGGDGNDVLDGAGEADLMDGGGGGDLLDGGAGADTMRGGAGEDTLEGGSENDELDGGGDADRVDGGSGVDTATGGTGDDVVEATGAAGDTIRGADGADVLSAIDAAGTTLEGGGGPDRLTGGAGPDALDGDDGDDVLAGGGGADALQGGGGADTLDGGDGADALSGGDGRDAITYEDAATGVVVSLDGLAADGRPGEGDQASPDVEEVIGSRGDDELRAGSAGATLRGGEGRDLLFGGSASDVLDGGPGDDRMDGGAGPDVLDGGEDGDLAYYGARTAPLVLDLGSTAPVSGEAREGDSFANPPEQLESGRGDDVITGADGVAHIIDAGSGDDRIDVGSAADPAPDRVRCRGGEDELVADRFDLWENGCERVRVGGFETRPRVHMLSASSLRVLGDGSVRVRLRCARRTRGFCTGTASLRPRGGQAVLATVKVRIGAGRTERVALRLTSAGRRALGGGTLRKLDLRITVRDALGRGATRAAPVSVRGRRP